MAGSVFIFGNNLLCHEKSIEWSDIITGPGATVQYFLDNGRTTTDYKRQCKRHSGVARIWRWGAQGVWGTEVPQRGPGAEPLVGGSEGTASRKLIAVIKDIWLLNHAQFCVFSSTAQRGIFL